MQSLQSSTQPAVCPQELEPGAQGQNVRYLQQRLNSFGYSLNIDGIFGAKTEAAVKSFQTRHQLSADGIVGPKTWHALGVC